jgi:TerC family integral membrane protein
MNVPLWVWALTMLGLVTLIVADLVLIDRGEPREFTPRRAAGWSVFYIGLAVLFGLGVQVFSGGTHSAQFFAGYLTEKSLSVDNLFIFYVIMTRFAVPVTSRHKVLMFGIVISLALRGLFIAVGVAALAVFQWLFFLFGAFLVWTALGLVRGHHDEFKENALLRWSKRVLPTTPGYEGSRLSVSRGGRRLFTPLFIAVIAIGSTDLLFALDSIPAIFGITKQPYLVFTTNAFALMGLVQLYFLLGGLVQKLVYLSYGLAFILGFIGVKLILEALHGYHVSWAPEIPIWLSLAVIGGAVTITTMASLIKIRQEPSATVPPLVRPPTRQEQQPPPK